ncbi:MAG TPA: hypothetical protein VK504_14790, partial [Vicinamibacterales bacterium]|nr:hypothetical protein [Vicinamibacterales bacterium]
MTDVVALLQDFAREKLGSLMRHQAAARIVSQYDANNTYQYVINREEVQLSWLAKAIEELGGAVPADAAAVGRTPPARGADAVRAVIDFHDVVERIRDVMSKVTLAITVVGGLVLFSGALILIGAVA